MLGIIGAMDLEVNALRHEMRDVKEQTIGFTRYYTGTLLGVPVCLARCGVGKVHAALCAQGMILALGVTRVLNIGVAGALLPQLQIGNIVVAESAVQHDMDTTPIGDPPGLISGPNIVHIPTDPAMTALLDQAAKEAGLTAVRAAIATGDQFIVGTDRKNAIARDFGAAACDMEGGAIAQCCYEMQVPYAAVRAISDTRDGDGREYAEKAQEACRAEEALLRRFLSLDQKAQEDQRHG